MGISNSSNSARQIEFYLCIVMIYYYTFPLYTGDITQQGFDKKKAKLLAPYMPSPSGRRDPTVYVYLLYNFVVAKFVITCTYNIHVHLSSVCVCVCVCVCVMCMFYSNVVDLWDYIHAYILTVNDGIHSFSKI